MPFKDPKKKREYHRKYMARKRLKAQWETRERYGFNRLYNVSLEDLEANLELVWYGEKPIEWKYYSLKEAAEMLKIHPNTLRKWIKAEKVKYIQEAPHANIYIPESEIKRLNPHATIPGRKKKRLKDNSGINTGG